MIWECFVCVVPIDCFSVLFIFFFPRCSLGQVKVLRPRGRRWRKLRRPAIKVYMRKAWYRVGIRRRLFSVIYNRKTIPLIFRNGKVSWTKAGIRHRLRYRRRKVSWRIRNRRRRRRRQRRKRRQRRRKRRRRRQRRRRRRRRYRRTRRRRKKQRRRRKRKWRRFLKPRKRSLIRFYFNKQWLYAYRITRRWGRFRRLSCLRAMYKSRMRRIR